MEDGADLFRTHEVWKTYAALWNDQLDNFTQVPTHIVNVVRAFWLGALAERAVAGLGQQRGLA
jgi:hypothetical protein